MHNSIKKIPKLINYLNSGESIALVSDAGMPGICDPGENLINKARLNKIKIICIPGPCAVTTALVSSGFPSSKFVFEGFLPKKKSDREKVFLEISKNEKTVILFESPHRLKSLLNELKEYLGLEREIMVSRELTKKFEELIGNNIKEVINYFNEGEVLGEITVVIKGKNKTQKKIDLDESRLRKELKELKNAGLSLSQASKYLAKKNKLTKRIIYNISKDSNK